nr:MAG TPA: hypothetical protein [Caudoviricetes sp.]
MQWFTGGLIATDLRSSIGPRIVIAINRGTPRKEPRDEHHGD